MRIRTMKIDDYEEIYKLWTSTNGMGLRSMDDSKEGISKFLNRNPSTNFVAIKDNKIVGVILCGHDGRRAYIYHTAVKENYRKQGIGNALIEAVYKALENEGINKVALVVFKTNEKGNAFWKAQGWEERVDLNYYNKVINPDNV